MHEERDTLWHFVMSILWSTMNLIMSQYWTGMKTSQLNQDQGIRIITFENHWKTTQIIITVAKVKIIQLQYQLPIL